MSNEEKTTTVKKKNLKMLFGIVAGGALGFAYYWFVGCSTGACPITSNPVFSTGYGAVIGATIVAWK